MMTNEPEEILVESDFNQSNNVFQGNSKALRIVRSGPNLISIPSVGPKGQIDVNQIDIVYQTRHKEKFFDILGKTLTEGKCPNDPDCFFQMGRNKLLDLQRTGYERSPSDSLPFQKKCTFCTTWIRLIPNLYAKYLGDVQYHIWKMPVGRGKFYQFIFYSYPASSQWIGKEENLPELVRGKVYYSMDPFHLGLKINLSLNQQYHFARPQLIGSFICRDSGTLVGMISQETPLYVNYLKFLESLGNFSPKDIVGWWGQLMTIYREFRSIGLFNLTTQSFGVLKEPNTFTANQLINSSENRQIDLAGILTGQNTNNSKESFNCSFSLFMISPNQGIGLIEQSRELTEENPNKPESCSCSGSPNQLVQINQDHSMNYLVNQIELDRAKILLEISHSHPPIQYSPKREGQIQLVKFNSAERMEAYAILGDPLVRSNIDLLFALMDTMMIPRVFNLVFKDSSLKVFWDSLWTDSGRINNYLSNEKYCRKDLWGLFSKMWIPIDAYQAIFGQWIRLYRLICENK